MYDGRWYSDTDFLRGCNSMESYVLSKEFPCCLSNCHRVYLLKSPALSLQLLYWCQPKFKPKLKRFKKQNYRGRNPDVSSPSVKRNFQSLGPLIPKKMSNTLDAIKYLLFFLVGVHLSRNAYECSLEILIGQYFHNMLA